jgi:hypothetical protein
MLRQDGFKVTPSTNHNYIISWGPDIPAVEFGLDGPAYISGLEEPSHFNPLQN